MITHQEAMKQQKPMFAVDYPVGCEPAEDDDGCTGLEDYSPEEQDEILAFMASKAGQKGFRPRFIARQGGATGGGGPPPRGRQDGLSCVN